MRPLLPGDLDFAVRVLLARPPSDWKGLAKQLFAEAQTAHDYRRSVGRPHPDFGTGSVMSAAARYSLAPLPPTCEPTYCRALRQILDTILEQQINSGA